LNGLKIPMRSPRNESRIATRAAERFTTSWGRHTTDLAQTAEARADGLRETAADLAGTDGLVAEGGLALTLQLREVR